MADGTMLRDWGQRLLQGNLTATVRMGRKSHPYLPHCSFLPIPQKLYSLDDLLDSCGIWGRGFVTN